MQYYEREFNFNPYIVDGELNYKNLKEKFPEIFEHMEGWFLRRDKKYTRTEFRVVDILANSFKKGIMRKYYE